MPGHSEVVDDLFLIYPVHAINAYLVSALLKSKCVLRHILSGNLTQVEIHQLLVLRQKSNQRLWDAGAKLLPLAMKVAEKSKRNLCRFYSGNVCD